MKCHLKLLILPGAPLKKDSNPHPQFLDLMRRASRRQVLSNGTPDGQASLQGLHPGLTALHLLEMVANLLTCAELRHFAVFVLLGPVIVALWVAVEDGDDTVDVSHVDAAA